MSSTSVGYPPDLLLQFAKSDLKATLMVGLLGAPLVPITIVFVLFSTKRIRRQPVFWIQLFSLALAMTSAGVELSSYIIDAERNFAGDALFVRLQVAKEAMRWFVAWTADVALVFRLAKFYPSVLYSRRKRVVMLGLPVLLKAPRLMAIVANTVYMTISLQSGMDAWPGGLKFQLVELTLQCIDGVYVSSILLRKSSRFARSSSQAAIYSSSTQRHARRVVEGIFMAFVPAACLQIVLLAVSAIVQASGKPGRLNMASTIIFDVHVYLNVVMSILATSWSSICNSVAENRVAAESSPSTLVPHRIVCKVESSVAIVSDDGHSVQPDKLNLEQGREGGVERVSQNFDPYSTADQNLLTYLTHTNLPGYSAASF